ncbi:hypothetical protein HDF26_004708 [Pedobacter cryoconitis]|uniref:lipoprotein N-acyltransferase Lnb domain-containing protein n=1 Tax=Pedobacter cryoconitis TaxID=188932 RepID=UPI0016072978|nr:DUF4105 domain-containing protein [Pedobacter cryoconitis]MBB6274234.1 hypothetical protein [Pedobacter cryoconitis]
MRKQFIILLLFILYQQTANASLSVPAQNSLFLSENSSVSVLTCEKTSKYLYSIFGHSAIRISDPERQIDLVYNYGTFDNDDPDFYINFINGRMKYSLSVSDYAVFLQEYMINEQSVSAQKLNLTFKQKNKLFALINEEIKPANKFYNYDFVRNNCATRIRDLLAKTIGPDFDKTLLLMNKGEGSSVRKMISNYLTKDELYMLGMNLLLGKKADVVSSKAVSLFLPDTLAKRLDQIHLRNTKLSGAPVYLFKSDRRQLPSPNPGLINKSLYVLTLLLAINLFVQKKPLYLNKLILFITIMIFTVVSLAGCLLIYLSVFSSMELVRYNLNILWCNPFYLLLYFKAFRKYTIMALLTGIIVFILCYFQTISFPFTFPGLLLIMVLLVLSFNNNTSAGNQIKSINLV